MRQRGMRRSGRPGGKRLTERSSEDGEVLQHRDDADDDHNDARDVLRTTVERQHIDEIENENDNQKGDQYTDQNVHTWLLASLAKGARQLCARISIVSSVSASAVAVLTRQP